MKESIGRMHALASLWSFFGGLFFIALTWLLMPTTVEVPVSGFISYFAPFFASFYEAIISTSLGDAQLLYIIINLEEMRIAAMGLFAVVILLTLVMSYFKYKVPNPKMKAIWRRIINVVLSSTGTSVVLLALANRTSELLATIEFWSVVLFPVTLIIIYWVIVWVFERSFRGSKWTIRRYIWRR